VEGDLLLAVPVPLVAFGDVRNGEALAARCQPTELPEKNT